MNCGYCRDCCWWLSGHEVSPVSIPASIEIRLLGRCEKAEFHIPKHSLALDTLAMAVEHDEYYAELWTAIDFGCVQFEARKGDAEQGER